MTPDPLTKLLIQADQASPPPPPQEGLLTRIQRRQTRQRRRGAVAIAAIAGLVELSIIYFPDSSVLRDSTRQLADAQPPSPPAVPNDAARRAELADLRRQAMLAQLTVDAILEAGAETATPAPAPPPEPFFVEEQRNLSALILVGDADRWLERSHRDKAIAIYRQTLELFPETDGANLARQRMTQLDS